MEISQDTPEITPEAALLLVTKAVDHAKANAWQVCAAVCDPAGHFVALLRTEDVVAPAIEFAIDKAYTAATLRTSTPEFFERAYGNPALKLGLANRPRVLVFPGGVPVLSGGRVIGGLGVSGAADRDDVACAEVALEALGLS
jgi:uncharacterized protein GlcG (DUF336 family)